MTDDEALEIARRVAQEKGWSWEGKTNIVRRRRSILLRWLLGDRRLVFVQSNYESRGNSTVIGIDEQSGRITFETHLKR